MSEALAKIMNSAGILITMKRYFRTNVHKRSFWLLFFFFQCCTHFNFCTDVMYCSTYKKIEGSIVYIVHCSKHSKKSSLSNIKQGLLARWKKEFQKWEITTIFLFSFGKRIWRVLRFNFFLSNLNNIINMFTHRIKVGLRWKCILLM